MKKNITSKNKIFSIKIESIVLDCPNIGLLTDFYIRLLGWQENYSEEEEWIDIFSPDGGTKLAFQKNELYVAPVWPEKNGKQQQQAHIDFAVKNHDELKAAVEHALSCGATMASEQYGASGYEYKWVTMLDPAGHSFCFVIW